MLSWERKKKKKNRRIERYMDLFWWVRQRAGRKLGRERSRRRWEGKTGVHLRERRGEKEKKKWERDIKKPKERKELESENWARRKEKPTGWEGKTRGGERNKKPESVSVCHAWMYSSVALETPATWIMSWLVALLLEPPHPRPQLSCLHSTGWVHATWDMVWWTTVHTHPHGVFIQTHTYNKLFINKVFTLGCPLYWLQANTFLCQHLNLSLPAGLPAFSVCLCVTWEGANLGPYLRLLLCSHSLLHKHLICHHCQSEQIRLPTAESARPPLLPLLPPSSLPTCPLQTLTPCTLSLLKRTHTPHKHMQ